MALEVKNRPVDAGVVGSIPGSPGEGNGNPLQYSCLENPMDRGAWQATVHGVAKESDMTEQLHFTSLLIEPSNLMMVSQSYSLFLSLFVQLRFAVYV